MILVKESSLADGDSAGSHLSYGVHAQSWVQEYRHICIVSPDILQHPCMALHTARYLIIILI